MAFAVLLLGAWVSVQWQGFQFGINNNVFHIPIVLRLDLLPQFQHDGFYQSLKYFVSGVWRALRLVATEDTIEAWFFALHCFSRFLFAVGFFMLAGALGVSAPLARSACAVLALFCPFLQGFSPLGGHDLLVNYFTHSELATALALVGIAAFLASRETLAWVVVGLIANINLFVAAWVGLAIVGATFLPGAHRPPLKPAILGLLKRGSLSLAIASPTLIWTATALTHSRSASPAVDFLAFIREYFPQHHLIDVADTASLASFAMLAISGVASAASAKNTRMLRVLSALLILLTVAALIPYTVPARLLLTIFMIRVDGLVVLASVGSVLAVCCAELLNGREKLALSTACFGLSGAVIGNAGMTVVARMAGVIPNSTRLLAVLVVVALFGLAWLIVSHDLGEIGEVLAGGVTAIAAIGVLSRVGEGRFPAALVILAGGLASLIAVDALLDVRLRAMAAPTALALILYSTSSGQSRWPSPVLNRSFPLWIAVIASTFAFWHTAIHWPKAEAAVSSDWQKLTAYVREHLDGVFLVPTTPVEFTTDSSARFQLAARQPSWGGYKEGAAVYWSPEYYNQWSPRWRELAAQVSLADHLRLACREKLSFLVWRNDVTPVIPQNSVVYRNDHFAVIGITARLCQEVAP